MHTAPMHAMRCTGRCYTPRPASPGFKLTCAPDARAPAPDAPAAVAAAAAAAGSSTRSLSNEEFVLVRLMLPLVAESPAHSNTADICAAASLGVGAHDSHRGSQCCCQRMLRCCCCACCPCWISHLHTQTVSGVQTLNGSFVTRLVNNGGH
jgi:hypothetical protein